MPRNLQPCGTPAAYYRHLHHGEEPDDACRAAHAAGNRAGGHDKVRYAALTQLAAAHEPEFLALAESIGGRRRQDKARAALRRRYPQEFQRLLTDQFARQAIERTVADA